MLRVISGLILSSALATSPIIYAKSLKDKLGTTANGAIAPEQKKELNKAVNDAQKKVDRKRYDEIVANPEAALNDHERMIALASREIFILVDRSGSMGDGDTDPTGQKGTKGTGKNNKWTRWDSARVAVKSIIEVALTLDKDASVETILWDGDEYGDLRCEKSVATCMQDIDKLFANNRPRASTPLAKVLDEVYNTRLKELFAKDEPSTVIILTDGVPNEPQEVKNFFKRIVKESNLEAEGRETLAAFSFVQMGDDAGADDFLRDLDDNLISETGISVDIADTKKDDFLFGTGAYTGKTGIGPFALLWDAIYD